MYKAVILILAVFFFLVQITAHSQQCKGSEFIEDMNLSIDNNQTLPINIKAKKGRFLDNEYVLLEPVLNSITKDALITCTSPTAQYNVVDATIQMPDKVSLIIEFQKKPNSRIKIYSNNITIDLNNKTIFSNEPILAHMEEHKVNAGKFKFLYQENVLFLDGGIKVEFSTRR